MSFAAPPWFSTTPPFWMSAPPPAALSMPRTTLWRTVPPSTVRMPACFSPPPIVMAAEAALTAQSVEAARVESFATTARAGSA